MGSADVVVFCCNWDGLSAVDAAAQARLSYPASVKVVRLSCLSRVHLGLILKAFELGADGVMLLGCERGRCHYGMDSQGVVQECQKGRAILTLMGIGQERLALTPVAPGDGPGFVQRVNDFISLLDRMRLSRPASRV